MKNKHKEFAADFKNEAELEEELEQDGLDLDEVESNFYDDEE